MKERKYTGIVMTNKSFKDDDFSMIEPQYSLMLVYELTKAAALKRVEKEKDHATIIVLNSVNNTIEILARINTNGSYQILPYFDGKTYEQMVKEIDKIASEDKDREWVRIKIDNQNIQ